MKNIIFVFIILFIGAMALSACGKGTAKMTLAVSFSGSGKTVLKSDSMVRSIVQQLSTSTPCTPGATKDNPGTTAGLDCDGDGGVVAYQTPTSYIIAFKSLYLDSGTEKLYLIKFDSLDKITSDGVKSFTSLSTSVDVPVPTEMSSFSPKKVGFEIYYFQLKLKIYGQEKEIRIYMSDDDFSSEGSKGHHQGDITYFDDSGIEHWARGGYNWFSEPTTTLARGEFANGVAGQDPETGHKRGMFGDASFWNGSTFAQGATKDYFVSEDDLPSSEKAITVTFDISNTWFYENFNDTYPSSFDPCQGSSLEACGGEWAPLLPTISVNN
ncbi:MAG: hypothetical protein HY072_10625 [Deltaproteobacteria bacterium]|nr:hypothetical protein [Deltaproteobacteria bacterium]